MEQQFYDTISTPTFLQAYNVLAAQIEQTRQLGQKLDARVLDIRDVDVSRRGRSFRLVNLLRTIKYNA